jgi:hypothetical protein
MVLYMNVTPPSLARAISASRLIKLGPEWNQDNIITCPVQREDPHHSVGSLLTLDRVSSPSGSLQNNPAAVTAFSNLPILIENLVTATHDAGDLEQSDLVTQATND